MEQSDRLLSFLDENDLFVERVSIEKRRRVCSAAERGESEGGRGEEGVAARIFDGCADSGEADERFHWDV